MSALLLAEGQGGSEAALRGPFPKVFKRLDQQTKDYFFGKRTEEMAAGLRPGRIAFGDRWVHSGALEVPGHEVPVALAGRIDTAFSFDDGSFGIIDFKTAEPKGEHLPFYGRQLHSYALAAENPATGGLGLHPVSTMGLLCIEPVCMVALENGVAYKGAAHFLEIPRDDDAFMAFLSQVLFLLDQPEPPPAATGCSSLLLPRGRLTGPVDRALRGIDVDPANT